MKKYLNIFVVVMLTTLAVSFSSCSKDDDEKLESTNIVGTWQNVSEIYSIMDLTNYVQFNSNGKYYEVTVDDYDYIEVLHGNWELKGNKISISGGNTISVSDATLISVSNSSLKLEMMGLEMQYKKVEDSVIDKYIK